MSYSGWGDHTSTTIYRSKPYHRYQEISGIVVHVHSSWASTHPTRKSAGSCKIFNSQDNYHLVSTHIDSGSQPGVRSSRGCSKCMPLQSYCQSWFNWTCWINFLMALILGSFPRGTKNPWPQPEQFFYQSLFCQGVPPSPHPRSKWQFFQNLALKF